VADLLLYGDTVRHPALRHEVPLEIVDPFLFVERDGRSLVLTSPLEQARIAGVRPDAEVLVADQLGFFELIEEGMSFEEADLETVARAIRKWGVGSAAVPPDLPVAVADRLRADGVELTVDPPAFSARRRVKTPAELAGIRRAARAAQAGIAAGERLIRGAERSGQRLRHDGEELTSETVRAAVRAACAAQGCPAPPDIMVVSALSGGGHDPGSGP
jgi:Xaa-Pro aminopeptidase